MKKLICLFFIAIIAMIAYFSIPSKVEVNDLMLENIEALAAGEGSVTIRCVGIGSVYCAVDKSKAYRVYTGYR